jgi:hypothetical protein
MTANDLVEAPHPAEALASGRAMRSRAGCTGRCTALMVAIRQRTTKAPVSQADQGLAVYPPWDSNPEPAD